MKKYIFTESQIKTIVNKVIEENINEQSESEKYTIIVQKFLNKLKVDPPLIEDGSYGEKTKRAIQGYQKHLIKNYNADLVVDGVWGPNIEKFMPESHLEIFNTIKEEESDIIDKVVNKVSSLFN